MVDYVKGTCPYCGLPDHHPHKAPCGAWCVWGLATEGDLFPEARAAYDKEDPLLHHGHFHNGGCGCPNGCVFVNEMGTKRAKEEPAEAPAPSVTELLLQAARTAGMTLPQVGVFLVFGDQYAAQLSQARAHDPRNAVLVSRVFGTAGEAVTDLARGWLEKTKEERKPTARELLEKAVGA